jgi:hypothetical protein
MRPSLAARPHPELLFGRFEVRALLGEGASGRVWRVHDRVLGAELALKELVGLGAPALLCFKAEFRCIADVHHPNLVRLYELFEQDSRWAFSMELVEGTDFGDWVRQGGDDDHTRLRSGLAQLTAGLSALHALGYTHRDVKPSNVRVSTEGRVVLLDFGLVTPEGEPSAGPASGTLEYMAPEQLRSPVVDPAADFYALGVLLHEALTGRLPFSGSAVELMLAKQARPPRASELAPDVPPDLDALCAALLEPEPRARAGAAEVLAMLGREVQPGRRPLQSSGRSDVFVGRYDELELALRSHTEARASGFRLLVIEGESGIGKTALCRRMVERIQAEEPALIVLSGRCHAAEQVPFKLFDGLVDELANQLSRLPRAVCKALLPEDASLLATLFPVLAQVAVIGEQEAGVELSDVGRGTAFAAFAELLHKLAERSPLLFSVDDLQWADEESLGLLRVLLEKRPSARALMLATTRELEALPPRLEQAARPLLGHARCELRRLLPLTSEDASQLSARWLGSDVDDPRAQRIAREAKGHPFFIAELAARTSDGAERAPSSLDEALVARFAQLDAQTRSVVELLAVSSAPVPVAVLGVALSVPLEELTRALVELRAMRWVRTVRRGELSCYHDRIRESVLGTLAAERRIAMHRQLALTWQRHDDADPAEIGRHFLGAELPERALPWLRSAAERAMEQQAFERAAALYEAVAHHGKGTLERAALEEVRFAHSDALASAGRSAEAARVLLGDLDDAAPAERTRRELHAARLLLRAGVIDEGVSAGRRALEAVSLSWPGSQASALARLLWHRADLALTGNEPRSDGPVDPQVERQLETLWGLWQPLGWADILRGAELVARHMRLSLASGSRRHVGLGLCAEALLAGFEKRGKTRPRELLERVEQQLAAEPDGELAAFHAFIAGTVAMFEADFPEADRLLCEAETRFVRDWPGEAWQLVNVRGVLLNVWVNRAKFALAAGRAEAWIAGARARGDKFAVATYASTGYGFTRLLMRDEPEAALAELDEAASVFPQGQFGMQHFGLISARHVVMSYLGGARAHDCWQRVWPEIQHSYLLRARSVRELNQAMRAESALRAAIATEGPARKSLLAEAERLCAPLATGHTRVGRACHYSLRAQVLVVRGERDHALSIAQRALAEFAPTDLMFARWGRLMVGFLELPRADAQRLLDAELVYLARQGWREPARCIETWLPALAVL